MPVKLETLDHVNYDRIMEIYKNGFSNASGLSVILVGNVNIDSIPSVALSIFGYFACKRREDDVQGYSPVIFVL